MIERPDVLLVQGNGFWTVRCNYPKMRESIINVLEEAFDGLKIELWEDTFVWYEDGRDVLWRVIQYCKEERWNFNVEFN